jgi:hypothetical protein
MSALMILEPFDLSIGAALLAHVLYGIPGIWPAVVGRPAVTLHNGDAFSTADEAPRLERLRRSRVVTGGRTTFRELEPVRFGGRSRFFGGG